MASARDSWAQARGYPTYAAYRAAKAREAGFKSVKEQTDYNAAVRGLEGQDSIFERGKFTPGETIAIWRWRNADLEEDQWREVTAIVSEMAGDDPAMERYIWAIIMGS